MKYWFDTEFIADAGDSLIHLISIGIVGEDGQEYYAENADCDLSLSNEWIQHNVLKHLSGISIPKDVIKRQVVEFVGMYPEFWAYYAAYDWVIMCQLYGGFLLLPSTWPSFCLDIRQLSYDLGNPDLHETDIHHALDDAKWNRDAWYLLDGMKK